MRNLILSALLAGSSLALGACSYAAPESASVVIDGQTLTAEQARWRSHIAILADDAMEGRLAGTPGYDRAADYVVQQFEEIGATPRGTDGWFQPVPLVRASAAGPGSAAMVANGQATPLTFGTDYVPGATMGHRSVAVDAPLIFVGQGIAAASEGRDDYAGLDLKGKIAVFAPGAPDTLQGEIRAHAARPDNKAAEAAKRGAIATIMLAPQQMPLSELAQSYQEPRNSWRKPDGTGFSIAPIPQLGVLSNAAAARLFGGALKAGAVSKATLRFASQTNYAPFESKNIVGMIPGTDPALADEYVVLTGHLDHLGVRADGEVFNGAMDNASGIASMIEAGRKLVAEPGRRPILLVALTAEEGGLVGSDYFARHPVVPISQIVGNVNLDMPILTYPFTDMFAFGADRSTLGPITEKALADIGITLTPDPDPREALFTRSDHYRFVQAGVPVLFLKTGFAGEGQVATKTFRSGPYHNVNDDLTLPFNWESGVKFVDANVAIARGIANAAERPRWNKGDYFGTLYGGYGAK